MKDARKLPQFNVRMPPEVKNQLTESAQKSFRSLNNEVVSRLIASLSQDAEKALQDAGR